MRHRRAARPADAVIVTASSVDIHAPKVVRATAGSIFHVPVVTGMAIEDVLRHLREAGVRTLAADGAGTTTLTEVDLDAPHAWVMGNEAWGLPEPVAETIVHLSDFSRSARAPDLVAMVSVARAIALQPVRRSAGSPCGHPVGGGAHAVDSGAGS